MSRYQNMIGGVSVYEAGKALGTLFPADTKRMLAAIGIRPCGGTLKNPRYPARLVSELAAIRASHKGQVTITRLDTGHIIETRPVKGRKP